MGATPILGFIMEATPIFGVDVVQPLIDNIVATVTALVPGLLVLTGIFLAVKYIPALIKRFSR